MFLDEALHINAGAAVAHGGWWAGLEQGKWFAILLYGGWFWLFGDSLLMARLFAVMIGALTVLVLLAEWRMQPSRSRVPYAAIFYLIFPATVFSDRVALTDQVVTLFAALAVYWSRMALRSDARSAWLKLFFALVAAPLAKSSGALLLIVPVVIYFIEFGPGRRPLRSVVVLAYLAVSAAVALGTVSILSSSTVATLHKAKLSSVWLTHSWDSLFQVARLCWDLFTPGFVLVFILGLVWTFIMRVERSRLTANLALVVLLVLPYILGAERWYPRYFLPAVIPLCLAGADLFSFFIERWTPSSILPRRLARFCAIVAFGSCGYQAFEYLLRPEAVKYPDLIRKQYITGWTAGTGMREMIHEVRRLSELSEEVITVARLPVADQTLQGVNVYYPALGPGVRLWVTQHWYDVPALALELRSMIEVLHPVYLLLNDEYFVPIEALATEGASAGFALRRVAFFPRPESGRGLTLWAVEPHKGNELRERSATGGT